MGFGWVIPEFKNYERLTFRGNIKNFPSSTRAELMAVFTALIVMPTRSKVIIYTDSACAIQNIKIIIKQINTREIWTKNKNPVILQMINDIVKEKRLKIICHKVKAHSGDKYNEIADSLAKIPGFIEGITNNFFEDTTISLNYNNIKGRSFIPAWKSTPIETPIKDAIKEINRFKSMLNFKYQERFKHIMTNTKCREIDWDLTFKTKHPSKITSDITNREDSNKRSFALKLLCEELLTLSKRYMHKPNLYSNSSCILCDELVEEDNMHVFTCKRKGDLDPIKDLTNKFKEILTKKIKKEESNTDIKIIKKAVNEIDILNYSYEKDYMSSKNYSELNFFDVIKGFIPNTLVTKVIKICRNKKVKAKKIIIDVLEEFQKILKQIWKERCDKVIEWEINNSITNKDKRMKQIRDEIKMRINVDKVPNTREGNLHTSKTIVEKVKFKSKQKQKEKDLEFFINETFLNTFTYKGNNLYKIKIFSDGDMAISS
jgi:ribonuclease HI